MRMLSLTRCLMSMSFFFFQAEDGIRDLTVTGVRRVLFRSHCPHRAGVGPRLLLGHRAARPRGHAAADRGGGPVTRLAVTPSQTVGPFFAIALPWTDKSEERRVGKECNVRMAAVH